MDLLADVFAERAALGSGCLGEVSLRYRPRATVADAEEYVRELSERLERDLERGFTGYGPHRDELAVLRDGRELRVYGSQGEQRLALLALLLAERAVLAAGARPDPADAARRRDERARRRAPRDARGASCARAARA